MSKPNTSRVRPSHRAITPADVTDILLWRLAVDVSAAHQPGPDGTCANLRCAGEPGPCLVLRQAQRAMRLARAGDAPAEPVVAAPAATAPPAYGWVPESAEQPAGPEQPAEPELTSPRLPARVAA